MAGVVALGSQMSNGGSGCTSLNAAMYQVFRILIAMQLLL